MFCVIIPTHNRERLLARALSSVLGQSYRDFEVVVVDDGSTDGTSEVVAGFQDARVRYFRTDRVGAGAARNMGVAQSTRPWIAFLDSDDEVDPQWLETAAGVIVQPGMQLFSCAIRVLRASGKTKKEMVPRRMGVLFADVEALFLAGTFFVRRDLFEAVGGYDEILTYSENYDLGIRLSHALSERPDAGVASTHRILVTAYEHDGPRGSAMSKVKAQSIERILVKHASALRPYPEKVVKLHGRAAVIWMSVREWSRARAHLRSALRVDPFSAKSVIRLVLTLPVFRWLNPYSGG